nr:GNAT family N-acetyltransferase [Maritimibacter sp. DP1N21-5]
MHRTRSRAEEARIARDMVARGWVRVARLGARVVGFIAVEDGQVHALYLARVHRGHGIGRALLSRVQSEHACLSLHTHAANHEARRFYATMGFRPTAIGTANDEGLTDIRFQWEKAT